MARKIFLTAGVLVAAATLALSQSNKSPTPQSAKTKPQVAVDDDEPVIKGGVDLVNVLTTVRNKNGGLVNTLEKADFKVYEDGKEQEIRNFSKETELPLTIGLLVDVSGSVASLIPEERRAGGQFFETVLRPKDLAFIISFGKDSELLQDSTSSTRLLQKGLDELRPNTPIVTGGGVTTQGPIPTSAQHIAGTVLYDAVYLAANERLRKESGRKVIILITDGEDVGSDVSKEKAIEAAQKSDAIIYSIYVHDFRYGGNEGVLKRMSEETGGRVFNADKGNLTKVFHDIEQEMRTQYSIDFAPKNAVKDGSYRKLDIRVSNKDYKVQARKGYYAIEAE